MGADPAKNDWELRFGNKRRCIDRDLLAEAERQIAAEEEAAKPTSIRVAVNPVPHRNTTAGSSDFNDMRLAISRAFGRPLV
jgi:hypothetical protein